MGLGADDGYRSLGVAGSPAPGLAAIMLFAAQGSGYRVSPRASSPDFVLRERRHTEAERQGGRVSATVHRLESSRLRPPRRTAVAFATREGGNTDKMAQPHGSGWATPRHCAPDPPRRFLDQRNRKGASGGAPGRKWAWPFSRKCLRPGPGARPVRSPAVSTVPQRCGHIASGPRSDCGLCSQCLSGRAGPD